MSGVLKWAQDRAHGLTEGASKFSYTGSIPHTIRQMQAQYDPRFESTRALQLVLATMRSVSVDREALARENKTAARTLYLWGQEHTIKQGGSDEALADIADRIAFILSKVGDLELAAAQRIEKARTMFREVRTPEQELGSKREKRNKLRNEINKLRHPSASSVPLPGNKANKAKAAELEAQLRRLEDEDAAEERKAGKVKRNAVKRAFEEEFDALIELGEKVALIARYGKLLADAVPSDAPHFPAGPPAPGESSWPGAERTAEIRAGVETALSQYAIDNAPVKLPQGSGLSSGGPSALGRNNTKSYGLTHRHEVEDTDNSTSQPGIVRDESNASMSGIAPSTIGRHDSVSSGTSIGISPGSPLPEGGTLSSSLNLNPSPLPGSSAEGAAGGDASTTHPAPPALPSREGPSSPLTPTAARPTVAPIAIPGKAAAASSAEAHSTPTAIAAPLEPTVAETGAPIHGTGGPSSGSLGAGTGRRASMSSDASGPHRPSVSSVSTSGGHGHVAMSTSQATVAETGEPTIGTHASSSGGLAPSEPAVASSSSTSTGAGPSSSTSIGTGAIRVDAQGRRPGETTADARARKEREAAELAEREQRGERQARLRRMGTMSSKLGDDEEPLPEYTEFEGDPGRE